MSNEFYAWLLTWLTEFVVWLVWLRRAPVQLLFYSILVNTLTQPLAVLWYHSWLLSLPGYAGGHVVGILAVIELCVLITEWLLIRVLLQVGWLRAFWIALTANLATTMMSFLF